MNNRILIVIEETGNNGAIVALRWFVKKLCQDGRFDVTLFQLGWNQRLEGIPDRVRQIGYPAWVIRERVGIKSILRLFTHPRLFLFQFGTRLMSRFPRMPHLLMRLFSAHKEKYDVVISYTDSLANNLNGMFNARKHFAWTHEDYSREFKSSVDRYKVRAYLSRLDGVFCVSYVAKNALDELLGTSNSRYVTVFHNLLPIPNNPVKVLSHDGLLQIMSVGRLCDAKRFEWCIQAAAMLKATGRKFRWTIVGEGEMRPVLEQMVRDLCVEDCVLLPGASSTWMDMVALGTVYVQPSEREGWGLALEEAALLGCKVVCSNLPVFREISKWLRMDFIFVEGVESLVASLLAVERYAPRDVTSDNVTARVLSGYEDDWREFCARVMEF